MVYGLNTFVEYLKDYKDYYVLIGGTACDIIMHEDEQQFRATKDLDKPDLGNLNLRNITYKDAIEVIYDLFL